VRQGGVVLALVVEDGSEVEARHRQVALPAGVGRVGRRQALERGASGARGSSASLRSKLRRLPSRPSAPGASGYSLSPATQPTPSPDSARKRETPGTSRQFGAATGRRAETPDRAGMILVDTSIWIDHLRRSNERLRRMLEQGQVLIHPCVIGEVALGKLRNRDVILSALQDLPPAAVATDGEVLRFV
jgi:hypothetical protein